MGFNNAQGIVILQFIVSLTISAYGISQQYVPCKPGWYFFGEKCYKILYNNTAAGLNWVQSLEACALEGGHLSSIHSNELQAFLTSVLMLNSKTNVWIGLHNNRFSGSGFSWADGSIFNYTSWHYDQPGGTILDDQDCVEMRYYNSPKKFGDWNDAPCNILRPYICQIDKNEETMSPDPKFCSLEDGGGLKYLNSCYHIVKEEKTWEDAEKYCEEKHKGYLVSITDPKAEIFVDYILKVSNLSQSIWIGIKLTNNSVQKWISGWHVNYMNKENLSFINGTCVAKMNWISWLTFPCKNKYPFICEKMKYNVPVLQKPPSDDWKCPPTSEKWLDLGGHSCYYVENELSKNWLEANYECGKIGGTLTSFHSENETNLLHHFLLDKQQRMFIGLKRNSKKEHKFEWADGTNVSYQNWHQGEPNSIYELCGELWTETMKWNDIQCDKTKGYVCKANKVFSYSKMEDVSDHVTISAHLQNQICSGGASAGTVVGIVFCGLLLGLIAVAIIYHYRDYWMRYFSKTEKDCYTSDPGSLGYVSDKVIWRPQELALPS